MLTHGESIGGNAIFDLRGDAMEIASGATEGGARGTAIEPVRR